MKEAEFKLENNDFLIDLFEKMKYEDPIFKPSANSAISYFKFLNYFKGLSIQCNLYTTGRPIQIADKPTDHCSL